jgi:hypothetical protein
MIVFSTSELLLLSEFFNNFSYEILSGACCLFIVLVSFINIVVIIVVDELGEVRIRIRDLCCPAAYC